MKATIKAIELRESNVEINATFKIGTFVSKKQLHDIAWILPGANAPGVSFFVQN